FTDGRREILVRLRGADAFLPRLVGRLSFGFERERRALRKPIAFFAVAPMGSPVAAALPAIAPITPPTTAPTGPPTLPSTAPATATTAAAVATASTAAAISATAASALRASFPWTRFVHGQSAAFHGFAIKLCNGILRLLFRRHRHKSEATRLACEFILHKHDI